MSPLAGLERELARLREQEISRRADEHRRPGPGAPRIRRPLRRPFGARRLAWSAA